MFIPDSQTVILRKHFHDYDLFGANCPVPYVKWSDFHSNMPADYDHMVAIMRCKGRHFGSIAPTNEHVEHFGVSIHVRSLDQEYGFGMVSALDSRAGSQRILNAPVTVHSRMNNGANRYLIENAYRVTEGVVEMGREPGNKRRWCFVTEMNLVIRYLGLDTPVDYTWFPDKISLMSGAPDSLVVFC